MAAEVDDTAQLLYAIPSFDHLMSGGPAQGAVAALPLRTSGRRQTAVTWTSMPCRTKGTIGDGMVMGTGEATLGHVVAEAGANPFAESGGSASIRQR